MEEEAEKMVALKKAYAEVILNTSKEAAARVMVSERKALRLQHDLRNTKDEALRMLIRMKHMIDAKTAEAEITSLSQQRKIEELDAQLNEAEGVIVDLRAELRKAHDELEQVKNSHMPQSIGQLENEDLPHCQNTAHEKKLNITEPFRSSAQCGTYCDPAKQTATSGPHLDNFLDDNANLASIIIRSKEPELYRNGCTHRIRAIERNLLDEKVLPEDEPDQDICTKKELIINEDEQNSGNCAPSSIDVENTDTYHLDGSEVPFINISSARGQPVKVQRLPRNSVRVPQSNPKLSRFRRCQSIKPISKAKKVNFKEKSSEQDEKLTENNEQSAASTLRRSLRKRKVRRWDDISSLFKSRAAVSRCKNYSRHNDTKSGEHKSKSGADVKQITFPMSLFTHTNEETKTEESSGLLPKDTPGVSSCNIIIEKDKVLETDSVVTESAGKASGNIAKNSLLKYTFSRKRKKDISYKSDDCFSPGKSFMTGKMGEKSGIDPEMEKSSLIEEPFSDSQNMVEVACQLISLSGKHKW